MAVKAPAPGLDHIETPATATDVAEAIKSELKASFEFTPEQLAAVATTTRGGRGVIAKVSPYESDVRYALSVALSGDLTRTFGIELGETRKESTVRQQLNKAEQAISGIVDGTKMTAKPQPAVIDGKPVNLRLGMFLVTQEGRTVLAYRWRVVS